MEDRAIGYSWGKRTVIRFSHIRNGNERIYICRCECGSEDEVGIYSINAGRRSQCSSCRVEIVRKKNTKHGHSRDRTHKIWRGMIDRCENPLRKDYPRYGGKGICVSKAWHDFEQFLFDMGYAPAGLQIDRINGLGNYEAGNCRWATLKEQLNNRNFDSHIPEEFRNVTGKKVGNWKIFGISSGITGKGNHYECECICGVHAIIPGSSLYSGRSKQCKKCIYKNRIYAVKPGRKPEEEL